MSNSCRTRLNTGNSKPSKALDGVFPYPLHIATAPARIFQNRSLYKKSSRLDPWRDPDLSDPDRMDPRFLFQPHPVDV